MTTTAWASRRRRQHDEELVAGPAVDLVAGAAVLAQQVGHPAQDGVARGCARLRR